MELRLHTFSRNLYRFFLICLFFAASGVASAATMILPATSSTGNYTISWTSGYGTIYIYENVNGAGVLLATRGPNSSYQVTGKNNGTYSYYLVYCTANPSPNSPPVCEQLPVGFITVLIPSQYLGPAAPASVSASLSGTSAVISWPAVTAAATYNVLRNGVMLSTVGGTSHTDGGLAPGSYSYQVQACNANGCSGTTASNQVTVNALPVPAAPATVSASSGGTYAYVSWSAVSGATSYSVQRAFGMTGPVSTTATDYADTGVLVGSSYSYQVKACNSSGCSAVTTSNTVTIAPPAPSAPTGVTASASGGAIYVSWNGASGATSYTVRKSGAGSTTEIPNVGGTGYGDGSVAPGTTYTYNVKACNSSGCSAYSSGASATAPVAVPAAPSNVSASSGSGYAYVSWSAVGGATSYSVQRLSSMTGPVSTTATDYADISVTVGNSYSYQVKACNSSGCSAAVTTNTITIRPPVPSMPTGVTATPSGGAIYIAWSAASGATSYTIQKNAGGAITTIPNVGGTGYADANVAPGATYTYNVKACNASGCSANSAGASATAPVAVPAAPATVSASSGTGGGYAYVSWTAVGGATSYSVQRVSSMTAPVPTTATDYADLTVTVGNSYSYQVKACNSSGCSAVVTSNAVTIAPFAPATPTGLSGTASGTAIVLGWNPASGATYYALQRTPTGAGFPVSAIASSGYTDPGLAPSTVYSYSVRACNGTGCSAWSAAVAITSAPLAIPVAPASLTAIQLAATVRLSWPAVTQATLYKLKRINGATVTALPDATATSASDTSVAVDVDYSYQVQACNAAGCSSWTSAATIKVPHIPAPPTSVGAVVRQNIIFVSWPNNDNATSARLSRNGTQISAAASSPYTDASVVAQTVYTYGVSACNVTGCSSVVLSAPVTAGVAQAGVPVLQEYVYDVLGRLNKVKDDGALKTGYDYDKAGNRTQVNE